MHTGEVYQYIPILRGMGDFDMAYCQMDVEFPLITVLFKNW